MDAYGALAFLSTLGVVDPDRIGLIGWSHGGITALGATNANGIGSQFDGSFQAIAAVYPYCIPDRTFTVPAIVLIGEADDWTPASACRELEQHNKERQTGLKLVVYPEAFHAFDNPAVGAGFFFKAAPGQRHWLQYNQKAHEDALERLVSFFRQAL
ncbi:MAG: dienelactone hydrolase family protein [Roseibium sp.]|uniref:dienelactone hydrolase family protein n=1 Tax=Roseibium sp. TaxID=1936156 RepID=UPI002608E44E|nr:dienelactone hydrolase family protein [Roseibium sp.]MCV0424707.1 dienelactone hydrolase family protein [Roseibium sp.]